MEKIVTVKLVELVVIYITIGGVYHENNKSIFNIIGGILFILIIAVTLINCN